MSPPFQITADDGRTVKVVIADEVYEFQRLRWRERNRAVHGAVVVSGTSVTLAPIVFAERVLAASLVATVARDGVRRVFSPEEYLDLPVELGDLLMATAVHINGRRPVGSSEGAIDERHHTVTLGDVRYTLAAWTWGTRNRVLARVSPEGEGGADIAAFHELVLDTMCTALDDAPPSADWLDTLSADVGDALLDAALQLTGLDQETLDAIGAALHNELPHDAVRLYQMCNQFGWTPSQVRQQLASDIDALWAVHQAQTRPAAMSARASAAAASPVTANQPGETVILAVDD